MKRLFIVIVFLIAGLLLGQPAMSQPLDEIAPVIQAETQIPVLLPKEFAFAEPGLIPEVIYAGPDGYYVAYSYRPDCGDAGFCSYARIKGYRLGSAITHFKPDSLETLINERTEVLTDAPHISPDPIETVQLADGTVATVLPWFSYTNPGNTEVIFEQDGIRYLFAIEMVPNDAAISLANSALERP